MQSELIRKLKNELSQSFDEAKVVYILTRIYKVLEIEQDKASYPSLAFYRHWTVHNRVDSPGGARQDIVNFIHDSESRNEFTLHQKLRVEINRFLTSHSIVELNDEEMDEFIFHLGYVIADTPVIVRIRSTTYKVSFQPPIEIGESGAYSISPTIQVNTLRLTLG